MTSRFTNERFLNELRQRQSDLIGLTRDLIAIPTLNPPGAYYRDICTYLERRLTAKGFSCQLLRAIDTPGDSDRYPRWNLIARHEGQQTGPTIHFNGHTDIVTVGDGWSLPPFEGLEIEGRIYGRGACDMKGGLASAIIAAETFIDFHPDYYGAIEISGTADEETGGFGGVAWLAEQGFFSPARVDHVIIPEPLNKHRICLGHRGVWWAEIETKGRIAHGSMPFLGDSAIRHMTAFLTQIEDQLYPRLATRITKYPVVPEQSRQSSLNINALHGGADEAEDGFDGFMSACVADSCRIVIDRRFLMEETIDSVKQEIIDMLDNLVATRTGFDYEIRNLFEVIPSMTSPQSPLVTTFDNAIEAVLGYPSTHIISPGTYDQKHIDRIGKLKSCIAYGPGILDLAHQPDEYIIIEDMILSANVMGQVLASMMLKRT